MNFWDILMSLPKTIYFNFKYFPLKAAIKFPVLIFWKVHLQKMGGKIVIPNNPSFGMIRIGFPGVGIFDYKYSRAIWDVSGKVIFEGKARIGQGTKINVGSSGYLYLGSNFNITAETAIICNKKIIIGRDVLISWQCLIMDTDFHYIYKENIRTNYNKEIIINDHVWIGCRVVVLKGTTIATNCVVSAGTILNRKIDKSNVIIAGSRGKIISENVDWRPY